VDIRCLAGTGTAAAALSNGQKQPVYRLVCKFACAEPAVAWTATFWRRVGRIARPKSEVSRRLPSGVGFRMWLSKVGGRLAGVVNASSVQATRAS
jgi:hypothetical protein